MLDKRPRTVDDAQARDPRPPAQVHVLEVEEEVLDESVQREERVATDQEARTGDHDDIARLAVLARLAVASRRRDASGVQRVGARVAREPVIEQYLGADDADAGIGVDDRRQLL
jgi:hypothetical protein